MRTTLLVLVRWQGDIVATHTVEQGKKVQSFEFLDGFASGDVRAEVYDVTPERALLGRLKPKLDMRAVYGLMVSGGLHAAVAVVALLTLLIQPEGKLEADDANRRAATVQDALLRISANEGANAGAVEPPKEEKKPAAEPEPEPLTVDESPTDDPNAPAEATEATAPVEPVGVETPDEGSETPGTKGNDLVTASPSTCAASHPPKNTGKICRRTVVVTALDVPPSCFTDTVMQLGQTGTLSYPCEGDGEAKLTFGKRGFTGASIGGKLDLCAGTEYPFSDGCRWQSAQRVSGNVATMALHFNYGEAPKPGQNKHCAAACSATGIVSVK